MKNRTRTITEAELDAALRDITREIVAESGSIDGVRAARVPTPIRTDHADAHAAGQVPPVLLGPGGCFARGLTPLQQQVCRECLDLMVGFAFGLALGLVVVFIAVAGGVL